MKVIELSYKTVHCSNAFSFVADFIEPLAKSSYER